MNAAGEIDLRRESGLSLAANCVFFALNLGVVVVLASRLGASGAGRYFLVVSAASVVGIPVSGVASALRKRGTEVGTDARAYLGLALAALVGYAGVTAGVGHLVGGAVPGLVGVALLGRFAPSIGAKYLDTRGRPALATVTYSVREGATLAGFALLPLATFRGAVLYRVGVGVALTLCAVASTRTRPVRPGRREVAEVWSFARWKALEKVGMKARREIPVVVLGVVVSPAVVTLFETANRIVELGSTATTSITDPVLVKLSALHSAGERGEAVVAFAYDVAPAVPFAVLVGVALAGREVLGLALPGRVPPEGVAVVLLLAGAKVGYAYYDAGKMVLYGLDRPRTVALVAVSTSAVALVVLPVTARVAGVVGVAGAVLGVTTLTAVGYTLATRSQGYAVPTRGTVPYLLGAAGGVLAGLGGGSGATAVAAGVATYAAVTGVSWTYVGARATA